MTDWCATTTTSLIEDGTLEIGDGYRAKNAEFVEGGGLPFVRVGDVGSTIKLTDTDELPRESAPKYGAKVSRPFDSLITMKGTVGRVAWVSRDLAPFVYSPQISYWRSLAPDIVHPRWLRYWLESPEFVAQAFASKGATDMADYINLRDQRRMRITLPPLPIQRKIAAVLGAVDDLVVLSEQRVGLLEDMKHTTYREWFIRFRLPGHDHVVLQDSPLGPIPEGWEVKRVSEIASRERNAVTAGPFGSKLGRADYVGAGVPVIRGTNLRVGGGFDEGDFVFVTAEKAAELRSSAACRGDIVITQRGTLGQVGMIPDSSRFDSYVLSQSQMKVTVDPDLCSATFIYNQFRTPETTSRFVAQAMSAGVPHVNLTLLRSFELLCPPRSLQERYANFVNPLDRYGLLLQEQARQLRSIRALLLPRVMIGQLDISSLAEVDGSLLLSESIEA